MSDLRATMEVLARRFPNETCENILEPDAYRRLRELIVVQPVTPVRMAWERLKELTETAGAD